MKKRYRTKSSRDYYDWDNNLDEAQRNLAALGQMRTGATGLLERGDAVGTAHNPTDYAEQETLGRRSGPARAGSFSGKHKWSPEMDKLIMDNYRVLDKSKRKIGPGQHASIIARQINAKFKTSYTKEAVIGRYHRIRGHYADYKRPNSGPVSAVPEKATGTPSLPKLKFLGDVE